MEEAPTFGKSLQSKESKYTIISDKNNSFSISIILSFPFIKIIGSFKDELINHIFKIELSLDELKKINKYFLLFETIDETYEDLILLMNKNQTKILEEANSIRISIPLESKKIKEITFIMKEEEKDDKEIIKELFSLVADLKKEIKEIKEENQELKTKMNKFENYIPLLENYKKEEKEVIQNLDSLIINGNNNYNKTLKKWINQNKKIKAELLYRASRDGEEYQTFHKLCDNKGPTIVLVKLSDSDILGTYTPIDWEKKNIGWKNDPNIFVFSLTRNIKAAKKKTNNNYGIYCDETYGPESYFLCFKPGKKMKEPLLRIDNTEYEINTQELVPGKQHYQYYKAEEVEIFKIIME